jgi:hypothetical protein
MRKHISLSADDKKYSAMNTSGVEQRACDDALSENEILRRYQATLKNVIATPPDHKTNPHASPKKRGRPPKANREPSGGGA